mmetsp:Transcript_4425/g.9408  ORF Transcript_4425/g.9408 Transcript_4425/m.9408 type:complete len:4228 (+) Transcript_4425:42-12725(+)
MQKAPQMEWKKPTCMGEKPSRRSGHTFSLVKAPAGGSVVYLFGGCNSKTKPPGPCNDLYKLDLADYFWGKVETTDAFPPSRWHHTANTVNDTQIVVFGGFSDNRGTTPRYFNDMWILDTVTDTWSKPPPLEGGKTWENCPVPRGAHSSTVVDNKALYVFGGYGGTGYSRHDFNDLLVLDLESWEWKDIETKGEVPEARSGHQTAYIPGKLYVCGGWNAVQQFDDLYILDIATATWSKSVTASGEAWGPKRWNHSALGVFSVPFWKMFVFGGNSGDLMEGGNPQGTFINDLVVLESGSNTWSRPEVIGETPSPRADTPMVFDEQTSSMIVFGGWSNRWYDDVYTCRVSDVVGPPYSIEAISPQIGPITGSTTTIIRGMGFESVKGGVTVRYACMKGFLETEGNVLSDTELSFPTPNYEKFGPVAVECRVAIGGKDLTCSTVSFKYFSVTSCDQCLAFGPGITDGCIAMSPVSFVIEARDSNGVKRICGMDDFCVKIRDMGGLDDEDHFYKLLQEKEAGGEEVEEIEEKLWAEVDDIGDGTYLVTFLPQRPAKYQIDVEFLGSFDGPAGPIRGSPFTIISADAENGDEVNELAGGLFVGSLDSKTKLLKEFCNDKLKGLRAPIDSNSDVKELITVKEHLRDVEERAEEMSLLIDSTTASLQYLKAISTPGMDRKLDAINNAKDLWNDVLTQAPVTETAIVPVTKVWAGKTTDKMTLYAREMKRLYYDFKDREFFNYSASPKAARDLMVETEKMLEEEKKTLEANKHLCSIFGFPDMINDQLTIMKQMESDIAQMRKTWDVTEELDTFILRSKDILWREIDPEALEDGGKFQMKCVKGLHKDVRWSDCYKTIDKNCKDFQNTIPLIQMLGSKAMRPRHWDMLMKATHKTFVPPHKDPDLLLGGLLSLNLHEFVTDVEEICDQANKEEKMEIQLADLTKRWQAIEFLAQMYQNTDVPLLAIQEEDFEALEADQLMVQGFMASRFLAQFEEEVIGWQKGLANVSDVYMFVQEIQRTWSYLEPLFIGSEEVKRELPEDAVRFAGIDVDVKDMLRAAWATKNIKEACNLDGLIQKLEGISEQLDMCKKSLADFLDGRRRQFPRYYFTSEADLLDILSNGSQPAKINIHTPKVYLMGKSLILSSEDDAIGYSDEGRPHAVSLIAGVGKEVLDFEPPVPLNGKVEIYMQTILDALKYALFCNLKRSLDRYQKLLRHDWVNFTEEGSDRPADAAAVILLGLAVNYVQEVEDTFALMGEGEAQAMEQYSEKQIEQLSQLIRLTQTKLGKGERQRVMVCITMDAHGRDIVKKMILQHCEVVTCFQWASQLKHKFRVSPEGASFRDRDPELRGPNGERAEIAICDAILPYDYEYLGNGFRLVITPLTDRIYVTATQALNLMMGCAPAGPAGTGKTESTKDLANALAKCCYVTNCSPEMDYRGLGNIFQGVSSSGAWICFDEFNRLIPEVLSVCTVQFKAVCDGCKAGAATVVIEGAEVRLDPTCGAFITMNPGYLGRSELPEGLKALFRPMTVMVPDLVLICENFLMAEGFAEAKVLASKFYSLYSLLKDLLSKQEHYDWGLRAIKSVLVVAGQLLRGATEGTQEAEVLMRALRDFNIPKIVKVDEVVFFGLLGDLFPGLNPARVMDKNLEACVIKACERLGFYGHETTVLKSVQLQELLDIRHCVFCMGPAGSAKSTSWKILQEARNIMKPDMKVKVTDLNPKVLPTQDLYGYINMATREWKDGLLSNIMRALGQIEDENPKWIMLDGDLDANWIESMNSVMDDNRMLTLASNERIPLKPHMRLVFEIRDLKHATPATVSRAGILYISTADGTQWRSLINSWLRARRTREENPDTPEVSATLRECFDTYVGTTLFWMKINITPVLALEEMSFVQSLLFMLDTNLTSKSLETPEYIETSFVFCAIWAFGSALTVSDDGTDYKKIFSDYWRGEWKNVKFPSRETVFDYWLDPELMTFDQWTKSPYFYTIDYFSTTPMSQVTVPTPETCSVTYWMELLVDNRRPIMLAGPAGTGKTQMVNGMLAKQDETKRISATVNFNFYTTSAVLLTTMCIPLEKKTGVNFGPPGQKKLIYFVDDINLPEVDKYMTQSAIALLRQQMEYEHVYDLTKLSTNPQKNIANTQFVTCMNPTAGSFEINPRLQRWFTVFAIGLPGPTSLLTIYQTFLDGHLRNFDPEVKNVSSNLIKAALSLHTQVAQTFRKTAANFHYEFNIRHLAGVFSGLLMAKAQRFNTAEKTAFVWCHECERVYGDRLVSYAHLDQFYAIMMNQAKKAFGTFNTGRFYPAQPGEAAQDILIFSHFGDGIGEDPVYDKIENVHDLSVLLEAGLEDYNETNVQMDLVLFEDAMRHICKITRVINNPAGHALLVGVGGSGKQSLSKLASHICGFSTMSIQISATYGISDLKTDLQSMYRKAGINQVGVAFLFTDNQITNEKFLVYLNDLLNSGNIADLYAPDEKDTVCNDVISKAKAAGVQLEPPALYAYFISQVRRNLHVILCCSPVGDAFRNRCLKFPALVNCTVIDWFQPWPEEALYSVGKKSLADLEFENDDARTGIEKFLPASFKHVEAMQIKFKQMENREVYTTPKSYLELLALYKKLLSDTRGKNDVAQARLLNGIQKLNECASIVDSLKADVAIKLEQAGEKAAIANGIATTVQAEKEVVEMETENANIEAAKVAQIQTDVTAQAASAEADLAAAEPAVEAAMAALDTLDIKALGNCKSMMKPPPGVDDVFASVMVLMAGCQTPTGKLIPAEKSGKVREKNRDWGTCKKVLLGNIPQLVADLKLLKDEYDAGRVPHVNWKEVRPFIALEHFKVEIIMGKNPAAAGLTNFVLNIVNYYDIVVTVEPKRKALAEAKETLSTANERLALVKEKVHALQLKLAKLTAELDAATKSRQEAEAIVAKGKMKLDLAQRLIKALSSENVRWNKGVQQLKESRMNLIGDSLLSAAFISYIGPFAKEYRDELVSEQWIPYIHEVKIPMSDPGGPLQVLCTDSEIAKWNTQGLQSDQVSIENGAIVKRSSRWPLLIDPQLQGIAWIKTMEGGDADRPLQVVRLSNNDIMFKMTRALENGFPVLIENMGEKIDATLMPVVARNTMARGSKKFIKLGDDEVELHKDFQLYMHTKLSNPHYPPEIQAECTLVNFTVTPSGLEDQLLSLVVRKERPDLASKKAALIQQQNQFLIRIGELEDEILARLAAAQGDITEDVDLIEGLENAKKLSTEINKQLDQGKKTSKQINMTSEKYRPTARRGSQLFFIMQRLVMIHTYYIYSLNAFVVVFSSAIDMIQNDDKAKAKAAKGPKLRGLKKLQNFTKTIIHSMQRFPWSHNILLEASHASNIDMTSLNAFFSGEGPEAAKVEVFNVGDVVDTSFGVAKVLEKHIIPDTGLPKYRVEMKTSTLNGKPMQFTLSSDSVRKYTNYAERTTRLSDKITDTIFNYVRRGLFEQDKLLVTTLLFFTLQVANDRIDEKLVNCMLFNSLDEGATVPEETKGWMNVMAWQRFCSVCSQLNELIPECATAVAEFAANAGDWEKWFTDSKPEDLPMPGSLTTLGTQKRMPFLRALRPDRVTFTLSRYISESEGPEFTFQPPFDMAATYQESSASTPIFFVLFPGVDPTGWVEDLGKSFNITLERGMFVNISMGQGQEKPAEATLEKMSDKGGWVMLQNLHLMQSWLPSLERKLEVCSMNAHQDFRCFISAEPPGFAYMKNIPESLLQSCIKVANEAPADIKSNLTRAWFNFSQERVDACTKPTEFKACLFSLSWFHSIVLGRRRFGQQGWSRKYSFNTGDLNICANVLFSYLDDNATVPWDDLRYLFGEIMYGGHITDFWDRRTANTYLEVLFNPMLFEGGELAPKFKSPDPTKLEFADYLNYIESSLPVEAPPQFGLHPNAEIGYLTMGTTELFTSIVNISGGAGGGEGGGGSDPVKATMEDLTERLPENFVMVLVNEKAKPLLEILELGPFVVVALQECSRMNVLLSEMRRTLVELDKGLKGQLNMSDAMEDLSIAFRINQWPGRNPFAQCAWEKLAWFSLKTLSSQFSDLLKRVAMLVEWTDTLQRPECLWLPGLFNPTAYLTAVMQVTGRITGEALDKTTTETHVTVMRNPKDERVTSQQPENGVYVHGLYIEGARWPEEPEDTYDVGHTPCGGNLVDSRLKELLPLMPIMYVKAVVVQDSWEASAVGYMRYTADIYECPVYVTQFRGPTYIFLATLRVIEDKSKWTLTGTAIVLQTAD